MGGVKRNPSFTLNLSAGIPKIALLLPKLCLYPFIFCIVLRLAFDGLRYAQPILLCKLKSAASTQAGRTSNLSTSKSD
jgi:hypothetical protein